MDEHPVRLTLVDLSRGIGLAERTLWEIASRLRPERFEVRAWLSSVPELDALAEALRNLGTGVERFTDPGSRWDWKTPFQQWLQLRRERPRLVHVHHAPGAASLRVARLASADRLPVVVSCHGSVPGAVTDLHARRVYERADVVTTPTRADADQLVRGWGIERHRVRCVPYGADLPDEAREAPEARAWRGQLGVRTPRPLWVCPLRLESHRGQEVLLEAFAMVAERVPPPLVPVLALASEGPRRSAIADRIAALGLDPHVRFLEGVEPIGSLIAAADVVVFPVLDGPVPLTLLDALARGRPVAASALPAIVDLVRDGVDGRLVPPGNAAALASVLEDLHRRPEVALRLGREAAWRAREELSWARVVDTFEGVYDEALGLASFAPGGVSSRVR